MASSMEVWVLIREMSRQPIYCLKVEHRDGQRAYMKMCSVRLLKGGREPWYLNLFQLPWLHVFTSIHICSMKRSLKVLGAHSSAYFSVCWIITCGQRFTCAKVMQKRKFCVKNLCGEIVAIAGIAAACQRYGLLSPAELPCSPGAAGFPKRCAECGKTVCICFSHRLRIRE